MELKNFFSFLLKCARLSIKKPFFFKESIFFASLVAIRGFIPIVFIMAPFGMCLALQGGSVLELFSAERMLGLLLGVSTVREIAPCMTAILISTQTGSAYAAEIAAMRAQEEIDATLVMGVNPIKYHIIPRITGMVLASPILLIIGAASAILAGCVFANLFMKQDIYAIFETLYSMVSIVDVFSGIVKIIVFALIISSISCFLGYFSENNVSGVSKAVNKATVYSITSFFCMNYIITQLFF